RLDLPSFPTRRSSDFSQHSFLKLFLFDLDQRCLYGKLDMMMSLRILNTSVILIGRPLQHMVYFVTKRPKQIKLNGIGSAQLFTTLPELEKQVVYRILHQLPVRSNLLTVVKQILDVELIYLLKSPSVSPAERLPKFLRRQTG